MARMNYLLDTNILSEPLVARPNPFVLDRIKANSRSLVIASVTWQEALYGMFLLSAGRRREQIEDYLYRRIRPSLPIIGFDEQAALWQAQQCARLRRMGRCPAYPDAQIAAIAAVNDLVLVTRNVSDFQDFDGLRVENWFVEPTSDPGDQPPPP